MNVAGEKKSADLALNYQLKYLSRFAAEKNAGN